MLAAMQEFSDRGFNDARFVLKILLSDPAKFGSFLRKMIPRVDDNLEPQIEMEKLAAVYLIKSLSGEYYFLQTQVLDHCTAPMSYVLVLPFPIQASLRTYFPVMILVLNSNCQLII